MIVCRRTAIVPTAWRDRYLAWITDGRAIRQQHGILAELVCQPSDTADGTEYIVITVWPSPQVFDAWIATPDRDTLTAIEVHRAVSYRPIIRYNVPVGYLNLPGLTVHDPNAPTKSPEEFS
jgi:heme-degrading monooxygenase HmoA